MKYINSILKDMPYINALFCHTGRRGTCVINGPNVDVYYWPSPNADTLCLSIIGDKPVDILSGATTSTSDGEIITYWGRPGGVVESIYSSIGGVTFKVAVTNPWATASNEINRYGPYQSFKPWNLDPPFNDPPVESWSDQIKYPSIHPRQLTRTARPIAIRAVMSETNQYTRGNGSGPANTVIYNGHTL